MTTNTAPTPATDGTDRQENPGRPADVLGREDLKTFILDTNVLLHNHRAIFTFGRNEVVIPIIVLEELDRFKRDADEKGRHARAVNRLLDRLREQGRLNEGVMLENGGVLRVEFCAPDSLPDGFEDALADNRILGCAAGLQKKRPAVTLITKDINLRLKADLLGLAARDYEKGRVRPDTLSAGWRRLMVTGPLLNQFVRRGFITIDDLDAPPAPALETGEGVELAVEGDARPGLGRYDRAEKRISRLRYQGEPVQGISALNREQHFAFDLLLDEKIELVTMVGRAGTGKTLLALAAGLAQVLEEKRYQRLLVGRPIIPMGRDIGFLPGSKEDKLDSWMKPIRDNLEFIFRAAKQTGKELADLTRREIIVTEALTYMRGRSLPNQVLLVDEAQNLTPLEVKTIVSRAGTGTKVILTGDPWQIDNPYLDASSNGLSFAAERFRGQALAGHITLAKSERSRLAELAGRLL